MCVFMLTKTLCHDLCCHIPAAVGSPEYRRVRAQQRAQESSDESDTEEGKALIEMKRRKRLETEIAQVEQRVRRMRRRAAIEEELRLRRENMAYLEQRTPAQVRTTPSRPRSWANVSLSWLYSHRNARANLHLLGQPNTRSRCSDERQIDIVYL